MDEASSTVETKNPSVQDWSTGENLLKWIDAYASSPGNARSCWLGKKKKLVCMSWREADTSDEEGEEDDDEEEDEDYVES